MPSTTHFILKLLCVLTLFKTTAKGEQTELFEKKIRPLLAEHCYECHSSSAEKVKGGLKLDSPPAITRGGTSGTVIVPGHPETSLLVKAVHGSDPDFQMPPKGERLKAEEISALEEWIRHGAVMPAQNASKSVELDAKNRWAFSKPVDPPIPRVKNNNWPKHDLDRFILHKLEASGLKPAPQADKRTLIRRATFDLIGLPPTPDEIETFIADKSQNAFAKVVDRLLASPHYGERWGRHWLDVVRYADSADARVTGGQEDIAEAWRYRDWVINAFNADLPYDEFLRQQIAGDLLPATTGEINTNAIIATGMYAIGNWGNGDADKEKVLTDIADDAVDVTGRALLGLTLSCARCHDHKFDPISIEDYYGMAGIFFSTHIIPKLSPKGSGESLLRIPLVSTNEMTRRKMNESRIAELEKEIEKITDAEIQKLAGELSSRIKDYLVAATSDASLTGETLNPILTKRWRTFLKDAELPLLPNPINNAGGNAGLLVWRNATADDTPAAIFNSSAGDLVKVPPQKLALHPAPTTPIALAWRSTSSNTIQITGKITDVDAACGDGVRWQVEKRSGTNAAIVLAEGSVANGGSQDLSIEPYSTLLRAVLVQTDDLLQLTIFPNEGHVCDTTLVDLELQDGNGNRWNAASDMGKDFLASNPLPDGHRRERIWYLLDLSQTGGMLAKDSEFVSFRKAPSEDSADKLALRIKSNPSRATNDPLAGILGEVRGPFWGALRHSPLLSTNPVLQQLRTEYDEKRSIPNAAIEFAHGLQEGGVPESPHAGVHNVKVHIRGRYDRLGEEVPRRFPSVLSGTNQPAMVGSGRLQLAEWIASPDNPLSARVMVNRIWMHHFGAAIVRTPNNFGKLGAEPTHPELLDFLSHRFVENGWSIKKLHRMIMLSAAYQQASSNPRADRDPENKLVGRMNRRRLEAEPLRDTLLLLAGNLDRKQHGPSIRDLDNQRRTLYLMTIRSDRNNFRMLFDAADPVGIADQRLESTVAPQALFMLNHPFALKQVSALANRVLAQGVSDENRIGWLHEYLYARRPTKLEIKTGLATLKRAAEIAFDRKVKDAGDKGDTDDVEQFAWEFYTHALLCANEFIYID